MKLKLTVFPAAIVVAVGLLLGISAAQAATVNFDPNDSSRAIGITEMDRQEKLALHCNEGLSN